jgi:hypothetical protein
MVPSWRHLVQARELFKRHKDMLGYHGNAVGT